MKKFSVLIGVVMVLSLSSPVYSATYDAARDYTCEPCMGAWCYEAYRAQDGAYLSMIFEHAPVTEVSKYGVDGHFLPDGEQTYYPFITKLGDTIICSPATKGKRYDAVLTWVAPEDCDAVVKGSAKLMGTMRGQAAGKKVKAAIMHRGETLWSGDVAGGDMKEFELKAKLTKGDKLNLHIQNSGDDSGDLTFINMQVTTTSR